jgi:multiple sugar transport system ATP-binding protein
VLDPEGPIAAKVTLVEPTGLDTVIAAEIGSAEAVIVVRERITAAPGEMLRLSAAPDRLRVFDPETESAVPPH